jgi:UDP-glucose 4-epimerase
MKIGGWHGDPSDRRHGISRSEPHNPDIGSVTVENLRSRGEQGVLYNLSRGHRQASDPAVPFYQGDVGDAALLARIARKHPLESRIDFAVFAYVGESVQPQLYFENNVALGLALFGALLKARGKRIIFSALGRNS